MTHVLMDATFTDIEALGKAVGWDIHFLQLDRGSFTGNTRVLADGESVLMRVVLSSQFHQRGAAVSGYRTFGILDSDEAKLDWCRREVGFSDLLSFDNHNGFDGVSRSAYSGFTFSLSEALLRRSALALGLDPERTLTQRADVYSDGGQRIASLRHALRAICATGVHLQPGQLAPLLAQTVVAVLAEPEDEIRPPDPANREHIRRRALNFIADNAADAVTVGDLCRATGASHATLDRAFRDKFGVSPKRYIMSVRLNQVRRALLGSQSSQTIVDLANRWGFWHMGQFARDYRRQFGELPSQTNRKGEPTVNRV